MAAATNNNNNNNNGNGDNSNSSTNSSPRQQGPGSPLGAGGLGGGGGMAIPGVASPATVVVGVSPSQLASTMAFVSGASSEQQQQQHSAAMRFSGHTLDKATKAKVHLENYYSNLITQHKERRIR